jgi:hypothetical protein
LALSVRSPRQLKHIREGRMRTTNRMTIVGATFSVVLAMHCAWSIAADAPMPKGFFSFGSDQTLADIGKLEWQPLQLEGLPPGAEVAVLRGDLAKGGAEILLRLPANYTVPNHSHTSDELYVWLKGAFTYIAADGKQVEMDGPAYIQFAGQYSPRAEMS